MLVETKKIISFCEKYLQTDKFTDYCHNGLQVSGPEKVSKIITGVTFSEKLIREAIRLRADMIMVHHGIFMKTFGELPVIEGFMRERLKLLLTNNIALAGFHLPLDAHPVIGNNISILKALKLKKTGVIAEQGQVIGYTGEYARAIKFSKFVELVNRQLATRSFAIAGGASVKRVGIVSGGAANLVFEMPLYGCDTYLTGEAKEGIVNPVRELKLNFVSAGHYNTEIMGIKNLGELIARKFQIPVEFVDVPCEI
jgi:dinuclear metal center YbgI/SA1388 family protein